MSTPWDREQRSARWAGPVAWLLFIVMVVALCIAVAWAFGSHWEDGRRRPGEAPAPAAAAGPAAAPATAPATASPS